MKEPKLVIRDWFYFPITDCCFLSLHACVYLDQYFPRYRKKLLSWKFHIEGAPTGKRCNRWYRRYGLGLTTEAKGHRELVQHGGLPSVATYSKEECWQAWYLCTLMDGAFSLHALAGAAQLRASGNASCWCCCYIILLNVYNGTSSLQSNMADQSLYLVAQSTSCKYIPSNGHISTPFFQKTLFFSKIFFGKPSSKFLEACLNSEYMC
jgi:hypothetical protein